MAAPVSNAVPLSGDARIDGLTQGSAWTFAGARTLTYSLDIGLLPDERGSDSNGGPHASWTESGYAEAFAQALAAWANVADVGFERVTSLTYAAESGADISAASIGDELLPAVGVGLFPDPFFIDRILTQFALTRQDYPQPEGDVFFALGYGGYGYLHAGGFGLAAMIHEIGHALGLKHPNDDGANARPTFAQVGVAQYDSGDWTLMSSSGQPPDPQSDHAATPMPLDILAIQHIYGANMSYRAGNDVYDLTVAADHARRTVWDAGGRDTFDASGLASGVTLDLHPGGFTVLAAAGLNIAIAFNVTIEDAVGSAFNDVLLGNAAANRLDGGVGDDTLDGGGGVDTATYAGNRAAYAIGQGATYRTVSGPEGTDTLPGIERLQFSDRKLAFDLGPDQAAGRAVRILGAAFDEWSIRPQSDCVGSGVSVFDAGASVEAVCELALSTPLYLSLAGDAGNQAFVNLIYRNVVGAPPSFQERQYILGLLEGGGGTLTQAQLLAVAAYHPLNELNIDLVGLQESGVEFL